MADGSIPRGPTYFACRWEHESPDDPVVLYEEIGADRMEIRKVHEYQDGRLVRSDRVSDSKDGLSWATVPPLDEIDADPAFSVMPLTSAEFDAVWSRAVDAE